MKMIYGKNGVECTDPRSVWKHWISRRGDKDEKNTSKTKSLFVWELNWEKAFIDFLVVCSFGILVVCCLCYVFLKALFFFRSWPDVFEFLSGNSCESRYDGPSRVKINSDWCQMILPHPTSLRRSVVVFVLDLSHGADSSRPFKSSSLTLFSASFLPKKCCYSWTSDRARLHRR